MVGLRLPDAIRDEVESMAAAEERSLSQMCMILIREALAARKKGGDE
jgi:hypothetical protein